MILVEESNFKVKHLLQCKSLYKQKLPLILYEDDPVVTAVLAARDARTMGTNENVVSDCSNDVRAFRADGAVDARRGGGGLDENGVFVGLCPHGFTTRLMGIKDAETYVYPLSVALDVLNN